MPELHSTGGTSGTMKAIKTGTLFSDQTLKDTTEKSSSSVNVERLKTKNVSIKLTHTGTISNYFVTVKFQSAETDSDTYYTTIVTMEFRDDMTNSFVIEDTRTYFRITAQADEGSASNYVTINADLKALGD